MGYEIDFLPVGDGDKSGDAIALRYGNLYGAREEQTVVVIDGGFTDDGEALVALITTHYETDYVDIVVATHPEQDHIKGLEVVLQQLGVGQLWMHQPWAHSQALSLAKGSDFGSVTASAKLQASLRELSDLEVLANERGIPIQEPFTGLASPDGHFFVLGPDPAYYEALLSEISSGSQASALTLTLRKLAEAAQRLVPANLHVETLTDGGETTPQNNSSVISALEIDGRLSIFTGDAGMPALSRAADLLEGAGYTPGQCKFIQIPHHGSRRNVGPTVLDRLLGGKGATVTRGTAYVSAARDGAPKHPAKKVTNAFRRRGYLPHATQGSGKRHFHQAPDRLGYFVCEPLPLYTVVEHSDD